MSFHTQRSPERTQYRSFTFGDSEGDSDAFDIDLDEGIVVLGGGLLVSLEGRPKI